MTANRPIALVTGAGKGTGRAIARRLAADGFDLVCWSRSDGDLEALRDEITADGVHCAAHVVDVSDPARVVWAVEQHANVPLDAVVVNAGEGVWTAFDDYTYDHWRGELASNLDGAFNTVSQTLGLLLRGRQKSLVAIGSDASLYPFVGRAAYAASKAGLRSLLETVRCEYRTRGLRVTSIHPSAIDTSFSGSYRAAGPGTRPHGLTADQVADVVSFVVAQPTSVELREIHLSSMAATFGPFDIALWESPG